ncbi:GntR family transcriptional regulator [Sphaerisporangium rufum]|uniref:GntR family transcriptional regulator n=1 Tax=Sphaerisporangium rufum TaxID=1381558 RepID=A0A919RB44_9ACTN|nr:TetR/AcrR family transcriptional regulator C-terminal domain-containing protein [Sphaerisporangium rufum]GII80705.1 GntR family transcriptional regulator [Sphaerisporangium rufum]
MAGAENATQPPYLRIAGEIRRRIETGDLPPGARVPSARQITAQWGVAMATAGKVLAALRQQGLVTAVPGVGTVVAAEAAAVVTAEGDPGAAGEVAGGSRPAGGGGPPPPALSRPAAAPRRPRAGDQELGRERIVRAGIEIADAEGLAALSMRRIAAALGVAAMSLYRHVPGKDELVALMVDTIYAAEPLPGGDELGWRRRMELTARAQWELYRRHPWLAQAVSFTRPLMSPNALAHTEWLMSGLAGLGLSPNTTLHAVVGLHNYVHGVAVNLEWEAEARQRTGLTDDEWMERQDPDFAAVFASGRFPAFTAVVSRPDVDLDLQSIFDFGLARLLDGLAVLIDGARR